MRVKEFLKQPLLFSIIIGLIASILSYAFQPLFPFQSIAHRGASNYAPENTMAAFNKAIDLKFDYIELDIRLSKDSELVVIHDADVTRTTNGEGFVNELTVTELKKFDAGSWFSPIYENERIPLLSEVIEEYGGRIGLLIEMKSPENDPTMTSILSQMISAAIEGGMEPHMFKVQSFHVNELKKFKQLCPHIDIGILLSKPLDMIQLASYRSFTSFLAVHQKILSKSFIQQAKLFDYEIFSWTVKYQIQFLQLQKLKVHGIISNQEWKE
ncbi:hypothetical protein LS684_12360 [Cytobacillus spongiae]|uniref:glycerophosphodiester phosphodiesterase n=1 Tax=Cytobacillus spongiae TaxID=2901381 RepID=UPI001F44C7AA|nr:glycerophosphodiester phosphodiesterase family protein [Cytobacillus spongiae]UII54465.1 hypothetical protein LS684_12360 [Cytobacillus spongiae]